MESALFSLHRFPFQWKAPFFLVLKHNCCYNCCSHSRNKEDGKQSSWWTEPYHQSRIVSTKNSNSHNHQNSLVQHRHTYIVLQAIPSVSSWNPEAQLHKKLPSVLKQLWLHPLLLLWVKHSFTSEWIIEWYSYWPRKFYHCKPFHQCPAHTQRHNRTQNCHQCCCSCVHIHHCCSNTHWYLNA